MKTLLLILCAIFLLSPVAQAGQPFTIDDYNNSLVKVGIPFYKQYPASFYTGFAPRVEDPHRIHFRAGRGNQVRLTAILDEYTVLTYLYYLKKRYDVYEEAAAKGMFVTKSTRHLDAYRRIIESSTYNILETIKDFEDKKITREQLYETSLKIITALNPHRVFTISIDLKRVFEDWKQKVRQYAQKYNDDPNDLEVLRRFLLHRDETLVLSNQMLPGRINVVYLTEEQKDQLTAIISQVLQNPEDNTASFKLAHDYFLSITAGKYDFQTVDGGGIRLRHAL